MSRDECNRELPNQACTHKWNMCKNHGLCRKSTNKIFKCECKSGFYGWRCEHQMDPCLTDPCLNKGKCQAKGNYFICKCSKEFEGTFCELSISKCRLGFCQNNGKCFDLPNNEAHCICKIGFIGDRCESKEDLCEDLICKHGNCSYSLNGPTCKCHPGYIGRSCYQKPCDFSPCPINKDCTNLMHSQTSRSSYTCQCKKWLTGVNCNERINPCEPNPCRNNGICNWIESNRNLSEITCTCPYYFFGTYCETFIKPDYELLFENAGVGSYVEMKGPTSNLSEVSIQSCIPCHFWQKRPR